MTFLIAAAGTGGHVFPGLAVGEGLLDLGVPREEILFVGGDRLEATVFPDEGFPFLGVELRGLQRSLTLKNLTLPAVVWRAKKSIEQAITHRRIGVVLAMGGYVTIPAGLAARRTAVPLFHSEQNAEAGLANRIAARWAERSFGSFPQTGGLREAEWVGNPVREPFWSFDRARLAPESRRRYGLVADVPVLGVFGGSLGAGAINDAAARMLTEWDGLPIQVLHLTGRRNIGALEGLEASKTVTWIRLAFEESMEAFYAVCDLVIGRAGGAVAELTATATPSILIPGGFGSAGHQGGNAAFLTRAGAATTLEETELGELAEVVSRLLFDPTALEEMRLGCRAIAKPDAARDIARAMIEASR